MMKFSAYLKISALILTVTASKMSLSAQESATGYNFLNIPMSSHAYALGGINTAIIDEDVMLVDQNPALLGSEIGKQAAVSYMHYLGSGNFGGVKYGMAAGERGAWSAGIRYLNYGSFDGYLADGTSTGSFTPQDVVFEGSYSHDITARLRGGVAYRMILSTYEQYSAFAMAVDLGLNYYNEEKDLSLSFVLSNMGGQIKRFDSQYNRLPFDLRIGYMQSIGNSPFQISINAWNLTKWRQPYYNHNTNDPDNLQQKKYGFFSDLFRHLVFGVQYSPSEKFYIGLGYNYKTRTDMSAYQRNFLSGFSLGGGIRVKSFGVGVSYAMPHKSASTIMLNLNWSFE